MDIKVELIEKVIVIVETKLELAAVRKNKNMLFATEDEGNQEWELALAMVLAEENKLAEFLNEKEMELAAMVGEKDKGMTTIINKKDKEMTAIIDKKDKEMAAIIDKKDKEMAAIIDKKDKEMTAIIDKKDKEMTAIIDKKDKEMTAIIDKKDEEMTAIIDKKDKEMTAIIDKKDEEMTAIIDKKDKEMAAIIDKYNVSQTKKRWPDAGFFVMGLCSSLAISTLVAVKGTTWTPFFTTLAALITLQGYLYKRIPKILPEKPNGGAVNPNRV